MADLQVKGVLSICVIVPTMTGDFPIGVERSGVEIGENRTREAIRRGSITVLNVTC
jgi:hypothetical protein